MNRTYRNSRVIPFLILAISAHLAIVLAPGGRDEVRLEDEPGPVRVRLLKPVPPQLPPLTRDKAEETPMVQEKPAPTPAPAPDRKPTPIREPVDDVPTPAPAVEIVTQTPDETNPSPRILSSQYDLQPYRLRSVFGAPEPVEDGPDFRFPEVTSLEAVLNEPSLQLPFEDRRIYLVDSYDAGVMGGIDRFFDTVTVPFGFTTKNNLQVKCVWVLIIAGCAWDHKARFYRPIERREPE